MITLNEAGNLAAKTWGTLNCDSVNAEPVDVDWTEAFQYQSSEAGDKYGDTRAEIVYPTFSCGTQEEADAVLDFIDERDSSAASEFRERLLGLDGEDAAELAKLDSTFHEHRFDQTALLPSLDERREELLRTRSANLEPLEDIAEEIAEKALELAQDEPEAWEPMMDCAYPLPGFNGDPSEAQSKLAAVGCVIVVMLDGEAVLALSGGGMDLSWEICHAHLVLGYRPPLHFCDLPRMAGRGTSDGDRALMIACRGSAKVARDWAQNTVDRITEQLHAAEN